VRPNNIIRKFQNAPDPPLGKLTTLPQNTLVSWDGMSPFHNQPLDAFDVSILDALSLVHPTFQTKLRPWAYYTLHLLCDNVLMLELHYTSIRCGFAVAYAHASYSVALCHGWGKVSACPQARIQRGLWGLKVPRKVCIKTSGSTFLLHC